LRRDTLPDVETSVIAPEALDDLLVALAGRGFRVLGPTMRNGAIVYDELESAAELPIGWQDVQQPGHYRLERRADEARFGYAVGPHSWKQFVLPARVRLWQAHRGSDGFEVEEELYEDPPLALIGVRACELQGIVIQDRVFRGGRFADRDYAARRKDAFIVAVNCFEPAGTCFCTSMGTGPKAKAGYDLALTEILDGEHRLLVEVGSERGAGVLAELPWTTSQRPVPRFPERPGAWDGRSTPRTSATSWPAISTTSVGTRSLPAASPAATARRSARPVSARASRTPPT
jgi:sulfhydrogenase subunit beta (sulfur reductase)